MDAIQAREVADKIQKIAEDLAAIEAEIEADAGGVFDSGVTDPLGGAIDLACEAAAAIYAGVEGESANPDEEPGPPCSDDFASCDNCKIQDQCESYQAAILDGDEEG